MGSELPGSLVEEDLFAAGRSERVTLGRGVLVGGGYTSVAGKDSRKMFFSAAIGTFVGRITGDGATDVCREWLPKFWDWLN